LTVDVEVGATRRRVDVRRAGTGWLIALDGRERYVDLAPADGRWSVLIAEGPRGEGPAKGESPAQAGHHIQPATFKSYEIALETRGRGERAIHVNGHPVPVSIVHARALFGRPRRDGSPAAATGSRRIVAPMPGRIVKVFVKAGDLVTAGQGLLVVEAMKMENEVRAPKAGMIAEVRVSEGTLVEANTLLVVME